MSSHSVIDTANLVPRPVSGHWHNKPRTTSSHWVIDTANLVPRPVTVSLTQQSSYHVQSQDIDTTNLVPRPVTDSLTHQTSYHIQSQSHWHSKPRTTSSHRVIDTSNHKCPSIHSVLVLTMHHGRTHRLIHHMSWDIYGPSMTIWECMWVYIKYIYKPHPYIHTHITISSHWDHKLLVSGNVYLTNAIGWCPPMIHAHMYIYTMITTPSSHWVHTANLVPCPVAESLTQ